MMMVKVAVLVLAAVTKYNRLGELQKTNLFLTVLEVEIKVPVWSGSGKDPLLGCSSSCILTWQKEN
jgi:hypothetical protein